MNNAQRKLISAATDRGACDRFDASIEKDPASGCWLWTGTINRDGYGTFSHRSRHVLAHRLAYQRYKGAFPEGTITDHLCRVRNCVNPEHLEPVTNAENLKRGRRWNSEKTHCPNGHEYSGDNLYIVGRYRKYRQCRKCHKIAAHKYYEKNKDKLIAKALERYRENRTSRFEREALGDET